MALEKIGHYSVTTPASVYDEEALTALELAGRTAAKTNEAVEAFNVLEEGTNTHLQQQDDKIQSMNDVTMPEKVVSEIQKNINNGTFDRQIEGHIGNLESRVDNLLGSVTTGSTTMDAEVIDGRVDAEGGTHKNLGTAIRHQINRVLFTVNNNYFYNRLNPNTVTHQTYINPTSGIAYPDSPSYYTTDFIMVTAGEKLGYYNMNGAISARFVTLYNSAKELIPSQNTAAATTITIPEGVAYIRATLFYADGDSCIVSSEYGKYIPVGKMVAKPSQFAPNYNMDSAYYYNRIVREYCVEGTYPNQFTGNLELNANYVTTNYIPVVIGETLCVMDDNMRRGPIRMLCVYDKDGVFIPSLSGEYLDSFTNTTNDVLYIRVAVDVVEYNTNTVMVAEITTPSFLRPGEAILKTVATGHVNEQEKTYNRMAKTLGANEKIALDAFPSYLRKNVGVSFKGSFTSFAGLDVGHGDNNTYSALWFTITPTELQINTHFTNTTTTNVAHGLTISDFIICNISYKGDVCFVDIVTLGGSFHHEVGKAAFCGMINAKPHAQMTDVSLKASCSDFFEDIWMFGDSYFGINDERVIGHLEYLGFNRYLVNGQPGLNSANAFADLQKALNFGSPKYLIWYLGMNDGAEAEPFRTYCYYLKELCAQKGITLILNMVPSVPNIPKDNIHSVIKSTGLRYIDSQNCVGGSVDGWKTGLLSSDNVHPTQHGAKVLAAQMLVDVPEIFSYGRKE